MTLSVFTKHTAILEYRFVHKRTDPVLINRFQRSARGIFWIFSCTDTENIDFVCIPDNLIQSPLKFFIFLWNLETGMNPDCLDDLRTLFFSQIVQKVFLL